MRAAPSYALPLLLCWVLLWLMQAEALSGDYPVTDFGAVGDGVTLNTLSIQKAIDKCAGEGGGRVVVGPGIFLSGTLVLKDHVELHISEGSVLLGSTNPADYPEMETPYRFYGDEWVKQSLIFGAKLKHIALSGEGVIDGQGAAFQVTTKLKPDRYRNRPFLIRFTECFGVRVTDLTIRNSAMWMQHYLACDSVFIEGITVYNHCNKNNDMIDIDGCSNVIVRNCVGDTDDDALTLKSTSPRPCENITISDCVLSSHCNAIKFGTESTGGFKNIRITNCQVKPSSKKEVIYGLPEGISGISLEVVDGGIMDGISIADVVIDGPEVPLFVRLGNRARPYMEGAGTPAVGELKNISIRNLLVRNGGKTGSSVTGIPGHPVENIHLSGIRLKLSGGVTAGQYTREVPELEDLYPEGTMFGILPASVLYMRHVDQITLEGIDIGFREEDERTHLLADDVVHMSFKDLRVEGQDGIRILELNKAKE